MCLLSQQNPAASSLEGAIWRGAGTQSRTLDAILYHPQQSHLVGSIALGLTLPLLYSRKSETQGWKDHLGDGEWQAVGDDESILALEITLNSLPIVQGFEITQSVFWLLPKHSINRKHPGGQPICKAEICSSVCPYFHFVF